MPSHAYATLRVMTDRHRILGRYARERRLSLDLSLRQVAARAGIKSRLTVAAVEQGRSVDPRTLWKLDRGLSWEKGSAERTLHTGEPPVELVPDLDDFTDPVEQQLWAITDLSEERRWQLIDAYRGWKERSDSPPKGGANPSGGTAGRTRPVA